MRLQSDDYIKLLKRSYEKIRETNAIPYLTNPNRSSIRRQCIQRLSEGLERKDEPVLRSFFKLDQTADISQALENSFAEKFRTLNNYLNGDTETKDKIIPQILAWLIDFPHRYFSDQKDFQLNDEELEFLKRPNVKTPTPQTPEVPPIETTIDKPEIAVTENFVPPDSTNMPASKAEKKKPTIHTTAIALIMLMIGAGSTMLMGNGKSDCMYWADDHFEKCACDKEVKYKEHFNKERMESLRMITRPDTITARSIGKVFYIKDNGVFFFTAGGAYPKENNKSLKKLSAYMFDKYLRDK